MKMTILFLLLLPAIARAEVYLTKEQALNLILGEDVEQVYQPKIISEELKAELRKQGVFREDLTQAHFFIGQKDGKTLGYALIDNEVGKHLPITYIVGINPAGSVTRVEMMVFREVRGWEARERRFMRQFEGKKQDDDIDIGSGLINVTGATLSSSAISRGVSRALIIWKYFYGIKEIKR